MANEIVRQGCQQEPGRHSRLDGPDLPSVPGRYFTLREAAPARQESTTRKAGRWDGAGYAVGEIEMTYEARRAVAAGTTLLAVRLHFVDDILHSVEFAAHPVDADRSPLKFMAEEFFTLFAPEEDGAAVRAAEIGRIQEEIGDIQARMVAPDPSVAALLPGTSQRQPSTNELVAAVSGRVNLEQRAAAIKAAAETRAVQVADGSKAIMAKTALLGNFYGEMGQAALARVSDQIDYANALGEGVKTLSLYTGEGVTVVRVCEGAPADPSIPLTFYQQRLYLDEELAVQSLTGGFDFRDLDDLGEIFAKDPGALDRMIPVKRGAVLVRVRREGKQYFSGQGDALAEALLNERNMAVYLLVRDGGNVHLVHSEITTDQAVMLFPTASQLEDLFKRHGGEVRPEHLDYSRARTEFDRSTVFYRRMLLMCWGLQDNHRLFGDFYDTALYRSWYDEGFQTSRLVFVHDAEGALAETRESFSEWIERHNRGIQAGSRLAAIWSRLENETSAPGLYSNRTDRTGNRHHKYRPAPAFGITRIERQGDDLFVKCRADGIVARTGRTVTILARIDVAKGLADDMTAAICADRITVSELDWYLNSRANRVYYQSYFHMFAELRKVLAAEEAAQAETLKSLAADMEHAMIPAAQALAGLREAVTLWRTQNGGRLVGDRRWSSSDRDAILNIAFAACGQRADLIQTFHRDHPGSVPIEIRIDGSGRVWLYREPHADERHDFEAALPDAFAVKVELHFARGKITEKGRVRRVYYANPEFDPQAMTRSALPFLPVREIAISSDPAAVARWVDRSLPGWPRHETVAALWDASLADVRAQVDAITEADVVEALLTIFEQERSSRVARTQMAFPVGFYTWDRDRDTGIGLLVLAADGLEVLASRNHQRAIDIVSAAYKTPEHKLEDIGKSVRRLPETWRTPLFPHITTPSYVKLFDHGACWFHQRETAFNEIPAMTWGWGKATVHTSLEHAISVSHRVTAEAIKVYVPNEANRVALDCLFSHALELNRAEHGEKQ